MRAGHWSVGLAAIPILGLFALPVVALVLASSPAELLAGVQSPVFAPALWLSLWTSVVSVALVVLLGTPLAWWMASGSEARARSVSWLVDLPIVLPPAVVGIALLVTFGRSGLLGGALASLNLQVPFTAVAVVLAQVVVSAPFYIQSATAALRRVDPDVLTVSRTLGHGPVSTFFRVSVPLALPGMIGGAALAWARALGEFGATLLFAGNIPGTTQTLPLAIYTALESDVQVAVALALVLGLAAVLLLLVLRLTPTVLGGRS